VSARTLDFTRAGSHLLDKILSRAIYKFPKLTNNFAIGESLFVLYRISSFNNKSKGDTFMSVLKTTLKIGAGILATVTIAGGIVTAGKHDERKKEAIEKAIAAPGPISVDGVKYSVRSFDKAPEGCQKLGAYRVLSSEGNLIAIASKPDAFRTVCTGKLQNG
jgi:hypothetical protein